MTTATTTWATLEDAATAMECSVRTVQRRIAAGVLQTRKDDSGRLQVRLPEQADTKAAVVQAVMHQSDTVVRMSESLSSSLATMLEQRERDQATIEQVSRRVRRSDLTAAVACVTAVALAAGLAWQVATSTRQATDTAAAQAVLQARYDDAMGDIAGLRERLTDVSVTAAQVGHLTDALADADYLSSVLQSDLDAARRQIAGLQTDLLLGSLATADQGDR
jgi:hypothetical protein